MSFAKFLLLILLLLLEPNAGSSNRVLVEVSRGKVVTGEVVSNDGQVLIIKDRNDELLTFNLDEVTRVVPLVDGGNDVTGLVILRDGRRMRGTILKDEFDKVVIKISGIEMSFSRDQVQQVYLDPPFEETYARIINSISLNNESQFIFLIEWLINQEQLDIAKSHLDASLLDTPKVNSLQRRVEIKIKARGIKKNPKEEIQPISEPSESMKMSRILTSDEVNLIRAYESSAQNPPDLTFSKETREQLLKEFAEDPRLLGNSPMRSAILHGSDRELFSIIRELRADSYYSQITSIKEPYALKLFSEKVHDDWLINRCGTNACHGGINSGILLLHRTPKNDDRARYANFLTLDRLEVDPTWPIINYDQPSQSLLIQYGLEKEIAANPHPNVKGWHPVPELESGDGFLDVTTWIKSMRQVPRPIYPIEYALPEANFNQAN